MNTNVEECAGFNKTNFVKQSTALVFGGRGSVIHHIEGGVNVFLFCFLFLLPVDPSPRQLVITFNEHLQKINQLNKNKKSISSVRVKL